MVAPGAEVSSPRPRFQVPRRKLLSLETMRSLLFLCAILAAGFGGRAFAVQNVTQSIVLQPGWNSVFLEVTPEDDTPETIFNGVDIDSVWSFNGRSATVDFVQDPAEPVWNRDAWLMFVPVARPESFQNNLSHLAANNVLLVKLNGGAAVTLSVVGQPSLRQAPWRPNAFNLRGFPVDPAAPPTFLNFFKSSTAHFNAAQNRLEKIYKLGAGGDWTLVSPGETVRPGVAYWVYANGASSYSGPLGVSVEVADRLDFDTTLTELSLGLKNNSSSPKNLTVADISANSPLSTWQFDPVNFSAWIPLPASLAVPLAALGETSLRLQIRRPDFSGATYESLLEIRDGEGSRFRVPVTAKKFVAPNGVVAGSVRSGGLHASSPASDSASHAGLWVGNVVVNGVNQLNSGNLATNPVTGEVSRTGVSTFPTPTSSTFNMRLLVHVDTNGQSRLLREVIQLFQPASFTNNAAGQRVQSAPQREVLVTEDSLIPRFQGGSIRDNTLVGNRVSSVCFNFDAKGSNSLAMAGYFGGANILSADLALGSSFPMNPFRHKFHPDHDNLAADFKSTPATPEVYPVARHVELEFNPLSDGPPASKGSGAQSQSRVSLGFNGSSQFVTLTNVGGILPTNEVTVEFWEKVNVTTAVSSFYVRPDSLANRFLAHAPWSDGSVIWDFGDSGAGGRLSYTPPVSLEGNWNHFAFVASESGNFMRIYRNGVLEAQKTGMSRFTRGERDLRLGQSLNGEMAEFRVWSYARSQSDILLKMRSALLGSEPGLVLYCRMNEGSGAALKDSANPGRSAQAAVADSWISVPQPFVGQPPADYGYSVIGGVYRETITGLHRDPLAVQGTFLLKRVSTTGVLNQ